MYFCIYSLLDLSHDITCEPYTTDQSFSPISILDCCLRLPAAVFEAFFFHFFLQIFASYALVALFHVVSTIVPLWAPVGYFNRIDIIAVRITLFSMKSGTRPNF